MKKSNSFTILRMPPDERERLKGDARRHEMTVTQYLKWLIERERGEDKNEKNNQRI